MYRRKLRENFPIFFAFTVLQILTFVVEFPVYYLAAYRTYFCTFWVATALNLVFDFGVIREIFLDVFRPYHALKDFGASLFKWTAIVMALVSGVFISTHVYSDDLVGQSIQVLHRCVQGIQCGVVLFLLACCGHLGVSSRRQSFGIALGLGCFASTGLMAGALFFGGHISNNILNIVSMTAYNLGVLIWLAYSVLSRGELFSPEQRPASLRESSARCRELGIGQGFESIG